jgi:hypothetical protein
VRFWFGFVIGALCALAYAYRKQIRDLIENRHTISTAVKTTSDVQSVIDDAKNLLKELQ